MHLHLLLTALAIAVLIRVAFSPRLPARSWSARWQHTLLTFLVPPLLLMATAIAVVFMGVQGRMLGLAVGSMGYLLALSFLLVAVSLAIGLLIWSWRSLHRLSIHSSLELSNTSARLLNTPIPFAAQIGLWHPQLVISQGLLNELNSEQLQAVLTHERAHVYFRDTFWFFWLGWLRQFTVWLPRTEELWAELILLREMRADAWAAQQSDPLVLAETLVLLVKLPLLQELPGAIGFDSLAQKSHLNERIDALLSPAFSEPGEHLWSWIAFLLAAAPLLTLMLHRL